MIYVIGLCMALCATNLFTLYKLLYKKEIKRPDSVELKEFLFDLMSGDALIQVKRVDPSNVVLRSPRSR